MVVLTIVVREIGVWTNSGGRATAIQIVYPIQQNGIIIAILIQIVAKESNNPSPTHVIMELAAMTVIVVLGIYVTEMDVVNYRTFKNNVPLVVQITPVIVVPIFHISNFVIRR